MPAKRNTGAQILTALLIAATLVSACFLIFHNLKYQWNWPDFLTHRPQILSGWLTTIGISLGALLASCLLGILLLLGQKSGPTALEWLCRA